jgi:hypothetical protein
MAIPSPVLDLLARCAANDHTVSEVCRGFPVPSGIAGNSDKLSQAYSIIARRGAGDTTASEAARAFLSAGGF